MARKCANGTMEAAWKRSPAADNLSEHAEDAMATDDPLEGERNEDRAVGMGGRDRCHGGRQIGKPNGSFRQ